MLKKSAGNRIKDLRKSVLKVNQEPLAEMLGVTVHAYSSWERGIAWPPPEKMKSLSKIFDVSMEYLYTGKQSLTESITVKEWRLIKAFRKITNEKQNEILTNVIDVALDVKPTTGGTQLL